VQAATTALFAAGNEARYRKNRRRRFFSHDQGYEATIMQAVETDVVSRIKTEISSAPVVLFMKGTPDFPQCGFSAQTVAALRALGASFKHINIFEEPELREALKRYSNWPTYPQLYVNGELVGGCDIALEMYHNGELKSLLQEAGAVS
jgi:monothiol glutaredoxin